MVICRTSNLLLQDPIVRTRVVTMAAILAIMEVSVTSAVMRLSSNSRISFQKLRSVEGHVPEEIHSTASVP
jgi:hypothetical protein